MKKLISILSVILLYTSFGFAQNANQPELESGTIESQFDYIITKSSAFKEFQLIRKTSILKVKKNALDSLKNIQSDIVSVSASIAPLQNEIKTLKKEIVSLKDEIEIIAQNKDSISIFGKPLNKTSYNTFVWSLVAVLLAALLFFVYQYKNSSSVTKKAKIDVNSMANELEEFKKKAMKKEQELMRKLQDEINKNS